MCIRVSIVSLYAVHISIGVSLSPTALNASDRVSEGGTWDILHILNMECCSSEPAYQAHGLTPGEVGFFHSNFSCRSNTGQNQWILEYMNSNCSRLGEVPSFRFVVCGKIVCQKLWLSILNVSHSRFYRVRSLYLDGMVCLETSQLKSTLSLKSHEAVAWLGNYFERQAMYLLLYSIL